MSVLHKVRSSMFDGIGNLLIHWGYIEILFEN